MHCYLAFGGSCIITLSTLKRLFSRMDLYMACQDGLVPGGVLTVITAMKEWVVGLLMLS